MLSASDPLLTVAQGLPIRTRVLRSSSLAGLAVMLLLLVLAVCNGETASRFLPWDPLGLKTPTPPPLAVRPQAPAVVPSKPLLASVATAAAATVVVASAQAGQPLLETAPDPVAAFLGGTPWVSPDLVFGALAVALTVAVVGISLKIAQAPGVDDLPLQTMRQKRSGKGGNVNTEKDLQQISQRAQLDSDTPMWKIRLQLMKPVTWAPLLIGVACGTAASGNFHWWNPLTVGQPGHVPFGVAAEDMLKVLVAMFMSGPLLTGYTQTINDWYDRDIDAINEPYRVIPSGLISGSQVIAQIWALLLAGVAVAAGLDLWAGHWFDGVSGIFLGPVQVPPITANAIFGSWVAYIYSAPPLKLKQSGWIGDYACGASYIALPWWCGQSLFGELNPQVMVLSVLYSIAGLGVAIVNDFKSMEGDRIKGLMSLTVQYGMDRAKWICAGTIDITQMAVALYLAYIGETNYALVLAGLIVPQVTAQFQYLLKDPVKYDVKYQVSALPFFASGIFCTALAMGHHQQLLAGL